MDKGPPKTPPGSPPAPTQIAPSAELEVYAFAQSKGIRRVYLQSGFLLDSDPGGLGDFVARAHDRGVAVTLLFGKAEWTLSANHAQNRLRPLEHDSSTANAACHEPTSGPSDCYKS